MKGMKLGLHGFCLMAQLFGMTVGLALNIWWLAIWSGLWLLYEIHKVIALMEEK